MAQIAQPRRRKDALDKIVQGLTIARGAFGIVTDISDLNRQIAEEDRKSEQRAPESPLSIASRDIFEGRKPDVSKLGAEGIKELTDIRARLGTDDKSLLLTTLKQKKLRQEIAKGERIAKRDITIEPKDKEEILGNVKIISDLDGLKKQITDKEVSEFIGPASGRVPDVLRQVGPLASGPKFQKFQAQAGSTFDRYRKLITGAQAAEREIALLQKRFPSITDTPETFKAKADAQIDLANAIIIERVSQQLSVGRTKGIPETALRLYQAAVRSGTLDDQLDKVDKLRRGVLTDERGLEGNNLLGKQAIAAPPQEQTDEVLDIELMND